MTKQVKETSMPPTQIHCSYKAGDLTLCAAVTMLIEQHGWPMEKAFGFFW